MEYRSLKGYSGWGQLGILFLLFCGGVILAGILQFAVLIPILPSGSGLQNFEKSFKAAMLDPKNMWIIQLAQVIGTLFLFFITSIAYNLIVNSKSTWWLGFNKYLTSKQVIVAFFIILLASVVAGPAATLSKSIVAHFPRIDTFAKQMEDAYNEQIKAMGNFSNWGQYLLAVIVIAFFPAVFEETFFRGALQNLFVRWWKSPIAAIIFTSLIFSAIHASIYLFISRAILGLALGYIYHKGKNIWINIIAHFLNNALAVTQMFYLSKAGKAIDPAKLDPDIPIWVGAIGAIALYLLFVFFDKISKPKVQIISEMESKMIESSKPFYRNQ